MRIRTALTGLGTALTLALSAITPLAAQAPADAIVRANVAAMTLGNADLPTGYSLIGETFLAAPEGVEAVQASYISQYANLDSKQEIRSYVYIFDSADAAEAGFAILEDESSSPDAGSLSDQSADVGDGTAELTTGTYTNSTGTTVGTADLTFVRGSTVVGIALDNLDGSAPDTQLVTDLAKRADERVSGVEGGTAPTGVDLELPTRTISFGSDVTTVQAGFLSPTEAEGVYGAQGTPLSALQSAWVESWSFGSGFGDPPRITIGTATFGSADEAKSVVEQAGDIFQPLTDQEQVSDVAVEGTDAATAFRYTSAEGGQGSKDSFRLVFVKGTVVTVVDVQGASDGSVAESNAMTIAKAQIDCQENGACEAPALEGIAPAN